jgi:hypothetical protein
VCFNRCGGIAYPCHNLQHLSFGGVSRHRQGAEHADRIGSLRRQIGQGRCGSSPSDFLGGDPIESEMHAFDTDIGAERQESIPLLHQTTVIAESIGLRPEYADDVPDAVELRTRTQGQM